MAIKNNSLEVRWNPELPIEGITRVDQDVIPQELIEEIGDLRERFGKDLLLLGHHYQRDEVVRFADNQGDSLALSQYAAAAGNVRYVMFLGVHFMAETADMLTPPEVPVILPDKRAGCTMADMAPIDAVEESWIELEEVADAKRVIPVTYINSTAAVKAFVGQRGGTICTSTNAKNIVQWALEQGEKLFFFPDQHLGRNTCYDLGVGLDDMLLWQPEEKLGGNEPEAIRNARVLLWEGHCSVHQHFRPEHVDIWRSKIPDIKVIVHPECSFDVVQKADYSGSTSFIQKTVCEAPAGTKWAVGTENHLVARVGREVAAEGKEVYSLAPFACFCSTMFRISPEALRDSLVALSRGEYRWRIKVSEETKHYADIALKRMFEITKRMRVA